MFPYDAGVDTGSVANVRRILVSPRWLVGHVLVALVFATTLWLAWWQWSRAGSGSGGLQNYGYALQWPLFGAFAVWCWVRAIRLLLHPPGPAARPVEQVAAVQPEPAPTAAAEDPELVAYNAYLAALHAADRDKHRMG
ncbi:hypothetical protein BH20ACT5_BH20ACT5_19110 [soil metagenome]